MSTSADLPPLPDSPLETSSATSAGGYLTLEEFKTLEPLPVAEAIAYDPNGSLRSHVHTALALAAFVACIIVRAFDPTAIDSDLLFLLAGGVLGTAGTGAAIRR